MNKEQLEKRLAVIEQSIGEHNQQIQQCIANINLLNGGKQECLFWLEELSKPQEEKVVDNGAVLDVVGDESQAA